LIISVVSKFASVSVKDIWLLNVVIKEGTKAKSIDTSIFPSVHGKPDPELCRTIGTFSWSTTGKAYMQKQVLIYVFNYASASKKFHLFFQILTALN